MPSDDESTNRRSVSRRSGEIDYLDNAKYMPKLDENGKYFYDKLVPPELVRTVASYGDGEPRIVIDNIVLRNFKSFHGEKVVGPFNSHMSCIIGANGSGKSNTIDSLLFVFGFRATKTRAKNLASLIHQSALHPEEKECSVTINFKKIIDISYEEWETVPNSEFSITRKAFFSDERKVNCKSQYYFNNTPANYTEITNSLKGFGIDLEHNRFLILQGEVEQIALMKHKSQKEGEEGMLEYLEDIIGSNRYIDLTDTTLRRRMVMERMKDQMSVQVKSVQEEVDLLQKDRDEAIHYYTICNDLIRLDFKRCCIKIFGLNKNLIVAEDDHKQKMEEEEVFKKKFQELSNALKENVGIFDEIKTKLNDKRNEKKKMEQEFQQLEKQYDAMREQRKHYKQEQSKMEKDLEKDRQQLLKVTEALPSFDPKIEEKKGKKEGIEEKLQSLQAKIDKENAKNKNDSEMKKLQDVLTEKEEKLNEKERKITNLEAEWRETESKIHVMQKDEGTCKKEYEQLRESCKKNEEQIEQCEKKVEEFRPNYENMKADFQKDQKELQNIQNQKVKLEEKILKLRDKVDSASSNQRAAKQKDIVKRLFEEQRNGRISGFLGRLGDLGGIDKKYDVAISTACGGMLDRLLFETEKDILECIAFLKKHNLGRYNFLPLDSQRNRWGQRCREPFRGPEGYPRLFDLITPIDEKYRPVFYAATHDRLVARNLDEGKTVAFRSSRRYDVACLTGELIHSSGSIRAGRNCGRRGAMGEQGITSEGLIDVEAIQQELKEAEGERRNNAIREQHLEESLKRRQNEMKKLSQEMSRLTSELNRNEKMKTLLSGQLVEKEKRLEEATPDEVELKKLLKVRDKQKIDFEKAKDENIGFREEVESIKKEIDEKMNGIARKLQKDLNDLKKDLKEVKSSIDLLTKERTKNERLREKLTKTTKTLEDRIEECRTRNAEISAKGKDIANECSGFNEKINEISEEIDELDTEYTKLESTESSLKKDYNERRIKLTEVAEKCKKALDKVKNIKSSIKRYEEEKGELSLGKLPDEETEPTFEEITDDELENIKLDEELDDIKNQRENLESERDKLDGRINFQSIHKYKEKNQEYKKMQSQLDNVVDILKDQTEAYEELKTKRLDEFLNGIRSISNHLKQMYKLITNGGDADLECSEDDPFVDGVKFNVRPPNKAWKEILNLSGGEKTLSSLALVFALHIYLPTPLYFMDEVDAALDYKNVSIIANYIRKRTKNAQFIVITLRPEHFELADRLVGIYKRKDISKSISLNPRAVEKKVGAQPPPALRLTLSSSAKPSQPLSQLLLR